MDLRSGVGSVGFCRGTEGVLSPLWETKNKGNKNFSKSNDISQKTRIDIKD